MTKEFKTFTIDFICGQKPSALPLFDGDIEESVTGDMSFDTFGLDSLDFVMYIMDLETMYDIELDEEECIIRGKFGTKTKTFDEINEIVNQKVLSKQPRTKDKLVK